MLWSEQSFIFKNRESYGGFPFKIRLREITKKECQGELPFCTPSGPDIYAYQI